MAEFKAGKKEMWLDGYLFVASLGFLAVGVFFILGDLFLAIQNGAYASQPSIELRTPALIGLGICFFSVSMFIHMCTRQVFQKSRI